MNSMGIAVLYSSLDPQIENSKENFLDLLKKVSFNEKNFNNQLRLFEY